MAADDRYDDDDEAYYGGTDENGDSGGILGGVTAGVILLAGIILFLFPEPFTSTIGIILIVVAVLAFIAGALM